MGLLDWLGLGKPRRRRRRTQTKRVPVAKTGKVCPKRTPSGKKVYRDKAGGCFTRKRVKKVSRKKKA